jgi:hypothetical protein
MTNNELAFCIALAGMISVTILQTWPAHPRPIREVRCLDRNVQTTEYFNISPVNGRVQ